MSVRLLALALLAVAAPVLAQSALPKGPSARGFVSACEGKDGWDDPSPPVRIFGNVYHVGTCGITALLIASDQGHVLIDSGTGAGAKLVAANLEGLGFKLGDVEWIVTSHEHADHVGGVAELKRLTGAKLAARAGAKGPLERGQVDWRDPQAAIGEKFEGAAVDRVLKDGEHLTLGPLDLTLHATPGHSPGSTSWSWRSCEGRTCRDVVYADSVTAVSSDNYRFADGVYVAAFRRSLDKIAALPCEVLITPHPSASALHERLAGRQPLADPQACRRYAANGRTQLDARVARDNPSR